MVKLINVQRKLKRCPALVRIIGFLATVVAVAAPVVIPLYRYEYQTTSGRSVIGSPILLCLVFVLGLPIWVRWLHRIHNPWQTFGIRWNTQWASCWGIAFILGVAGVGILCWVQLTLGWSQWTLPPLNNLGANVLNGLVVALLVGAAEELIFRGWILFELEQDYSPGLALWLNAGLYAIAHYLRPIAAILETWPQFFGLLLLGLIFVWVRRIRLPLLGNQAASRQSSRTSNLALAMGLHSGFVWSYYQVDVGDLLLSTHRVPDWLTGIGSNPLAGVLGILLLTTYAFAAYWASHRLS